MLNMCFDITVGKYKLMMVESVEINKSVDLLTDTAIVKLPGLVYDTPLKLNEDIRVGDKVVIRLGYDDNMIKEFEGYLSGIATDDSSITLTCEDALYLLRCPFKVYEDLGTQADPNCDGKTLEEIVNYLILQIPDPKPVLSVSCTSKIKYESYKLQCNSIYDELKKLHTETKLKMYLRENVLHIHPIYDTIHNKVKYDFTKNIEKASLKYKKAEDRKFYIEVTGTRKKTLDEEYDEKNGIAIKSLEIKGTSGNSNDEKKTLKMPGVSDEISLKERAEAEHKMLTYTGYEGNITTWLIPVVEPGDAVFLKDPDFEYKDGWYHVSTVKTTFASTGGMRTITLGSDVNDKVTG